MKENDCNLYYALVWNTQLSSKENEVIKGDKITKSTVLPSDPRILYGVSDNDIKRIRSVKVLKEIEYDIYTTKQSVKFQRDVKEYVLCRDVRIIVWRGANEINLLHDKYKIVTPELFETMVQISGSINIVDDAVGDTSEPDTYNNLDIMVNANIINECVLEAPFINKFENGKYIKLSVI